VNDFITCLYENYWWTGQVTVLSQDSGDVTLALISPSSGFKQPAVKSVRYLKGTFS